jgi:SUF system NifU family Fe-S assembly protein
MYPEKVMDHYKNPRNHGSMKNPDYKGDFGNPVCGDQVRVYLKTKNGIVSQASFEGEGCAISLSAASMLTEMVIGKSVKDLEGMGEDDFVKEAFGELDKSRRDCALVCLKAMKNAVNEGSFMC